jgi:hypothetical protein
MTAPMCVWEHCDRPARISVVVGEKTCEAAAHGAFCVPHSALTSRVLQQGSGADVWFDWVRSGRSQNCTCSPLFWSNLTAVYDSARRASGGEPRFLGLDQPDEVDPVGGSR